MKTYTYKVGILLMAFPAACSKSATEPLENETPLTIEANYSVLLEKSGFLTTGNVQASENEMILKTDNLNFPAFPSSKITFADGNTFSFFEVTGDCKGRILRFDFNSGNYQLIETFLNLDVCSLNITSIAHDNSHVFLTFIKSEVGKEDAYYVRIISLNDVESAVDVELSLQPKLVIPSNGKLFVLTHDVEITDENGISVIDINGQSIVLEKLVGFNAKKIFKDPDGHIVISYPELHTTLNSTTFEEVYTQYGETLRPNLYSEGYNLFDSQGKMYYTMNTEGEAIEKIPAVYDFKANTATLYYFENFLSETELNTELNIQSATAIGYDDKNNFILVGYEKNGSSNFGGILRLTPAPDFAYIDNIDLVGIPKAILTQSTN
ncbi:hypothetical protein NYZ99_09560 [Maribacter litopenaei]|uniref:DUF4221 domain-containing protein n=1 Tax=Maribacter litopenaei TaxID=2976127 RepID=A0ABY5YBJ1_9FLAO|nr:hypothetical protein [Maribacter litopenaei]UWX56412.1 hypothetical protein NYZ99_09560 [Maribacter litopenaei]